ncbi:PQQ-dependent sugar dehydrogenase [Terrisporobacter glycolicus]|nr:PQQ-dependent sugar dehydrogenase [Terrisporobacter glycolicus]
MKKVKVSLQPIVKNINLPTVLKTTIIPGDSNESLFIATQVGKIFYISNGSINTFLDIRSRIIKLGASNGGYDERGLLGLAFHPAFYYNGLFYLHYSVAGTQGPGALSKPFRPNPCDIETLNLKWTNRDIQYDHIDTVEEWVLQPNGQPEKTRTLLNLRRPFANHNGVNSLNFSPETGKLILTTGDGGLGYDPFNLSQDNMETCGKIIEIDVNKNTLINNPPVVTRFNELPISIQETLTVMAKGVRNILGISFQRFHKQYIKYIGNVGQDLVESIFSFTNYTPIPVTQLVQSYLKSQSEQEKLINFGWRGWEGTLPTSLIGGCTDSSALNEIKMAYYNESVKTSAQRLSPLACYFHKDSRPDKFSGSALTGLQPYMGNRIPDLTGSIVFTDFAQNEESEPPVRGVLAYTMATTDCKLNDFSIIETDYNFGSKSAYYVCLGTNMNQTRLYLGVYGSANVTNFNQGTIFEIVP